VVLGAASEDGKVALIVGVTKDLTGNIHAGKVVGALARLVGGKGGGRPDLRRRAEAMRARWTARWERRRRWWGDCWGRIAANRLGRAIRTGWATFAGLSQIRRRLWKYMHRIIRL